MSNATTKKTTAQIISDLLGNDGQNFTAENGYTLDHLCADKFGAHYPAFRDGHGTDTYRYTFKDGSAIVVSGGAWDLSVDDTPCYCWRGEGHSEQCMNENWGYAS